ncbi:hypothetical protein HYFRA_00006874 [Hymenoscyphus fraxineus]|uniref:Uncharacterized protein n=1 Tax=Hymenoscyphus fraxineus TaxID=746836 RepID=A0A9N9KNJ0_9HELO|nr:hypothetical protein HYFRA_00006874 [Hymenoscyphus fraxineus]
MSPFRASGRWKSDGPNRTNTGSSIRGRIGPPIPITDDEEFPIRAPGAPRALPLSDGNGQEQQLAPSPAMEVEHIIHQQPGVAVDDFIVQTDAAPTSAPPPPPPPLPIPSVEEGSTMHTSLEQPSTLRNSTTTAPSKDSMVVPHRKKSSLKTVFGRLFGKKRKSTAVTLSESPFTDREDQHRSVPLALHDNPRDPMNQQKRSASLPIDEYNRALRSHSVLVDPDDFTHRGTPDTNRDSIQADGRIRPRRATTPSRLWTPTKGPPPFAANWTGLSPRPVSSQARGSRTITAEEEAAIGMAVTSGSHPNRRSRSVGELRAAALRGANVGRRRSDEIRYWRESYDPGVTSPISSNKDDTPFEKDDYTPQELPQPFNFGPMGEMAGMKITQAASLETRVQRLESKVQKMEKAIIRLHRQQSADALQLQDPPRNSKYRPRTGTSEASQQKHEPRHRTLAVESTSQNRSSSYGSSRAPTIDTNTYPTSNLPSTDASNISSQNATARPLSTSTTIRGISSNSPTISKDGSFTQEHLSFLTNLIMSEHNARRELETVVRNLQKEISMIRPSTAYPTTNANHAISNHIIQSQRGSFSNFEGEDSSDEDVRYDDFRTPNEEREFQDLHFGDVMNDDQNTANNRTMSLSRMTVANGMQLV